VKKDAEQEDEAAIMPKMKSFSLVRIEGPIGDCQSVGSPIGNRSSPGLMMCLGASDDTSISPNQEPTEDQTSGRQNAHEDVGSSK
jgi:hypothetical protein